MLKIYGQARSRAFRVLWLCKESNIAYEHIPLSINIDNAQCKEPWYSAINPLGRVPAIDDDGLVMWESAAINFYLAEKYRSPLWPTTPQAKARALQWAFYIANDIEPSMITVMQNRVMFAPEKRNAALADCADAFMQPRLQVLDDHLGKTATFGVDRWDLADFMVASVCYSFFAMKYDLGKYPNFRDWLYASLERPMAKEARKLRE